MARSALRNVTTIAAATALAAVTLTVGSAAQAGSGGYVDDPDTYFLYSSSESTSDCDGNPSCDITTSQYYVAKAAPERLVVVAKMKGPTAADDVAGDGGLATYIDADGDIQSWEFGVATASTTFPLGTWIDATVFQWDGSSWVEISAAAQYMRRADSWVMSLDYTDLGIQTASLAIEAVDANGNQDTSPSDEGTPDIPIAAMVAGAPGQPQAAKAVAGVNEVTVSWSAPANPGASAITSYKATAYGPGAFGRNCTTAGLSCTITGLTAGETYYLNVTATNAQGTGPASKAVTATPTSLTPAKPTFKSKQKVKGNGKTASITVYWKKPAGATSFEIRWTTPAGWTPWKATKATSVTVKGIGWNKQNFLQVRALNSYGAGPTGTRVLYYGP